MFKNDKIILPLVFLFFTLQLFAQVPEKKPAAGEIFYVDDDSYGGPQRSFPTVEVFVKKNNFQELLNTPPHTVKSIYLSNSDPKELSEEDWKKFVELRRLTIECESCSTLPSGIRYLTQLTSLNLSLDGLKEIPTFVGEFENLNVLKIKTKAESIKTDGDLSKLLKVDEFVIKASNITSLPEEFLKIPDVKTIHIFAGKVKSFPTTIYKMTNLRRVVLSLRSTSIIPDGIGQLKKLNSLKLTANISKLPSDIYQLQELRGLFVTTGQVLELPEKFGTLSKLSQLNLLGKKGIILSEDFGQLSELQKLKIRTNSLKPLPDSFNQLNISKLELNCGNVPSVKVLLPNVKELKLESYYHNEWKAIENKVLDLRLFPSLTELDVIRINLENTEIIIPEDNKIERLLFDECQLTAIPNHFERLQHCKAISVGKQSIETIPDFIFQLPRLEYFFITKKYIESSLLREYEKNESIEIIEAR